MDSLLRTDPIDALAAFTLLYLFLQAFMVPGVVILFNILGGSIFPRPLNYVLVSRVCCVDICGGAKALAILSTVGSILLLI